MTQAWTASQWVAIEMYVPSHFAEIFVGSELTILPSRTQCSRSKRCSMSRFGRVVQKTSRKFRGSSNQLTILPSRTQCSSCKRCSMSRFCRVVQQTTSKFRGNSQLSNSKRLPSLSICIGHVSNYYICWVAKLEFSFPSLRGRPGCIPRFRDGNSSFCFSTSFKNCRTFHFAKLAQVEDSRQMLLLLVPFPRISLCAGVRSHEFSRWELSSLFGLRGHSVASFRDSN
jgi:hypothetical protein